MLAAADTVGRNFIPESMNLSASKPEKQGLAPDLRDDQGSFGAFRLGAASSHTRQLHATKRIDAKIGRYNRISAIPSATDGFDGAGA